jgi:hypothetical protein
VPIPNSPALYPCWWRLSKYLRRTLVVRHANAYTFALRASYSHIFLPPLRRYHSSQPPLPPVNYSRSFLETFLLGELASASPAAGIGILGVDRFLFEPAEYDLALLVSPETRIGMSMLDSATLKLVRVDHTTSKLAARLWSVFPRAIAGFFLASNTADRAGVHCYCYRQ